MQDESRSWKKSKLKGDDFCWPVADSVLFPWVVAASGSLEYASSEFVSLVFYADFLFPRFGDVSLRIMYSIA